MTVNTIINLIRSTAKERDAAIGIYSDKYLWELFLLSKATVLKNKKNANHLISKQNYHTFCLELEEAYSHECGCPVAGCKVLKSKYPIPRFICGARDCSLKLSMLDWDNIDEVDPMYYEAAMLDKIKKTKRLYSIVNNHVIIWNSNPIKGVQATALWEDVTEWEDITLCIDSTGDCPEVYNLDLGLDRDLIDNAVSLVFSKLSLPKGLVEDLTNDASDTIRE